MESLQLFVRQRELLIIIALLVQALIFVPRPVAITKLVLPAQAILVMVLHSFLLRPWPSLFWTVSADRGQKSKTSRYLVPNLLPQQSKSIAQKLLGNLATYRISISKTATTNR